MSFVPDGVVDATGRIIVTTIFFVWNLYEGSVLETPYTDELVKLYKFPFWRLALVFAVLGATYWCPRVGAMFALTVFFYFEDLEKLLQPWVTFTTDK